MISLYFWLYSILEVILMWSRDYVQKYSTDSNDQHLMVDINIENLSFQIKCSELTMVNLIVGVTNLGDYVLQIMNLQHY